MKHKHLSFFNNQKWLFSLLFFLFLSSFLSLQAATITSTATGGLWNNGTTWVGGTAPLSGDDVVIVSGATVTLNSNTTCATLTINAGGTFNPSTWDFTVNGQTNISGVYTTATGGTFDLGSLVVNAGGVFTVSATSFLFNKNISNAGTFTLNSSYTFRNNAIIITPNANMTFNAGGGTAQVNIDVTIAEGAGAISLLCNTASGVVIASTRTLLNQNQNQGSPTSVSNLTGAGTFTNAINGYLNYAGDAEPTVTNFNVSNTGSTFWYNGSNNHNIRNVVYNKLRMANARTLTLTAPLTVNENLELLSNVTFDVGTSTNSVTINGVLEEQGPATIIHQNGTFIFTGGNATSLSGLTDAITLFNVTINKTLNTDGVIFNNPLTIAGTLTLTKGEMVLGNSYNLILSNATPATQISPATPTNASYIVTSGTSALVRQNLSGSAIFPVGSATQYQPLTIVTPNTTSASVRFGTATLTIPNAGAGGSWFVNNGVTASNIILNNPQGILDASCKVYKNVSSAWTLLTTSFASFNYTATSALTGAAAEFSVHIDSNAFITTWQTTDGQITIPTTGGGYNYTATCTNITTGTIGNASVSAQTGDVLFSGLTNGNTYRVSITGTFPRIYFNNAGDKTKIKTIEQWGNIAWTSMLSAFYGCNTLTYNATDIPNFSVGSFSCNSMFRGCTVFNGNATMNSWNTALVTNMGYMFNGAGAFNQPIGTWNTAAVTDMSSMFWDATAFNQPIGSWNTTLVTNMGAMFFNATAFNQPIGSWNTANVTAMNSVFNGATAFNQPIGSWNTANVTNMDSMFGNAVNFNQPIGSWNTANVTNISWMFNGASAFNQPIGSWNTAKVTTMQGMFGNASFAFNQPLGTWQLRTAGVNMFSMLDNCGMNTANYDATLIGWAGQAGVPTGVTLGATGRTYCIAFGARNTLTATKGWTIADGGSGCSGFNAFTTTNVTANSFRANWSPNAGAVSYRIDVSTVSNFASFVSGYNDLVVGNVGSFNVTGLTANTVYYYRIKSYNGVPTLLNTSNTKMTSTILPAGSGNGLTFSGTTNVNTGTSLSLQTTTFTYEAWIKLSSLPTSGQFPHIIGKDGVRKIFVNDDGRIGCLVRNITPTTFQTFSNNPIVANQWYHVAASYDASKVLRLYINGVLQSTTATLTGSESLPNALILGTDAYNFNGQIDEAKVWNTTRTQPQIQASMCSKLAGTESGLVAYFRFDENTGTITENKAYGATFDGTLIGSPAWTVSTAPIGDISSYNATLNDTTPFVDAFALSNIAGSPTGYYLYKIKAQPNVLTPPTNYLGIFNTQYYGIFFPNGTNPTASIEYSYGNNPNVSNANALRFGRRDDVNAATWTAFGGIVNRLNKTVDRNKATAGQYILATRNAVISNARNAGTGLNFDGTSSFYGEIARPVQDDFTIEFWIKTSQANTGSGSWRNGYRIIDAGNVANTQDFGIGIVAGRLVYGQGNGSGDSFMTSPTAINDGQWYHVAITRIRTIGVTRMYINGKDVLGAISSGNTLSLNVSNSTLKIGGISPRFIGVIDEIKFWDTALTENTIKDWINLRANDTHPNFANLVAYYRCDDNIGSFAEDIANGSEANLYSGSMWTTSTQPLGDGAAQRLSVTTSSSVQNFSNAGLQITFGSGTVPNGDVVVTRLDTAPESYPTVAGMNFMSSYWVIRNYGTNLTFSTLGEMKFEVPANNTISAADLATPSNLKLFKRPDNATGNTWGSPVAVATGFGSVRFAGPPTGAGNVITEFSQFVIGSQSSPLAVSWVNFDGQRTSNNRVDLRWNTATESRNRGFEIQRSLDGVNFTVIGFKDGAGNSSQNRRYDFTDEDTIKSYYYRLRQIDTDDSFEFSKIIFIKVETKDEVLLVYPNPTTESIQLQTKTEWANSPNLYAEVFSTDGKSMLQSKGNLLDIQESINIWLKDAKSGVYIIKLVTPEKVLQTKLVKENR